MLYAQRGFPFTNEKLCHLAFELAKENRRKGFSPLKRRAGRTWLKKFLERQPKLRKKIVQNLSAARAMAANPVQVEKFFQLLQEWVHKWKLQYRLNHIWNVDETGLTDVAKERKVIGVVGERAFQTVAEEKGTTTTIVNYISAGGLALPPMVIFKAGRVKDEWREAAPSGYLIRASDSGYITAELFNDYGEKLVKFLRESNLMGANEKHMVLLDMHSSHLFNLKYMRYMKANGIEVCSFPPPIAPMFFNPWMTSPMQYSKENTRRNSSNSTTE